MWKVSSALFCSAFSAAIALAAISLISFLFSSVTFKCSVQQPGSAFVRVKRLLIDYWGGENIPMRVFEDRLAGF